MFAIANAGTLISARSRKIFVRLVTPNLARTFGDPSLAPASGRRTNRLGAAARLNHVHVNSDAGTPTDFAQVLQVILRNHAWIGTGQLRKVLSARPAAVARITT